MRKKANSQRKTHTIAIESILHLRSTKIIKTHGHRESQEPTNLDAPREESGYGGYQCQGRAQLLDYQLTSVLTER